MEKRMTITITSVQPGNIKGQMIAEAKARGYKVKFDVMTQLFTVGEGEKYILEIRSSPPKNLEKYVFCGHGYVVRDILQELKEPPKFTIISIWGLLFRFEPRLKDLRSEERYYVCLRPAK